MRLRQAKVPEKHACQASCKHHAKGLYSTQTPCERDGDYWGQKLGKQGLRSCDNNEMQGDGRHRSHFYLLLRYLNSPSRAYIVRCTILSTAANRQCSCSCTLQSLTPSAWGGRSRFKVLDLRFEIRDQRSKIRKIRD